MKKKLMPIVVLLLALVMTLASCGGLASMPVTNPQTNFDYVVRSNGGSAVQYGPYIYFMNGTRGYEDDGTQNVWGEVVKGGVYRAELNLANGASVPTVTESEHTEILYDFKVDVSGTSLDYDDKPIDVVPNERIAPVTVGTSGYQKGGIFIYDQYMYFATPNSEVDREGNVLSNYTKFIMMSLDGKIVKHIFTTQGAASDKPYGFYKMGDSVYLVCAFENEDALTSVVSVRIQGNKIHTPVQLTQKATSVVLAVSDTYDNKDTNPKITLSDYVFFTRNAESSEWPRSGNLIEVSRPDGSEAFSFQHTGASTAIEDVRDDLLFYTTTSSAGNTEVHYTNLYNSLMTVEQEPKYTPPAGSKSYREYENGATEKRGAISGAVFKLNNFADYTTKYYFGGGSNSNGAYMLGISSAGVYVISAVDTAYQSGVRVLNKSVEMLMVSDNYLYYKDGDAVWRVNTSPKSAANTEPEQVTDRSVISAGFTMDIVADHIMFFATKDQWTENYGYAYFKKLSQEGSKSFFVGTRSEEDIPNEDELESYWEANGISTDFADHEGHNHEFIEVDD